MDAAPLTPFLKLAGETPRDFFGFSVAGVGDANGDGYGDLVVGAPWNGTFGPRAGRAYLYFGGAAMDSIGDLAFFTAPHEVAGPHYGFVVAGAGDVNGDGYTDVMVNAILHGYSGRVYVYKGGPDMDSEADQTIRGTQSLVEFGSSISSAGDLNGDGYGDVIVGEPLWSDYYDPYGTDQQGRVFIYFGGPVFNADSDITLTAPYPTGRRDHFGMYVASIGDMNGDGRPDVVVMQTGVVREFPCCYGGAFVYYGGQSIQAKPDLELRAAYSSGQAGAVSGAGDFNGDGFDDLAVHMPSGAGGVGGVDLVAVYFGGTGDGATRSLVLSADPSAAGFGFSIAGGKDLDGDAFSDLIVGAPRANPDGHRRGRAYVFYGGPAADGMADVVLDGDVDGGSFGYSVSQEDVTGDGVAEAIVGGPGFSPQETDPGHVYIYDLSTPLSARAFVRGDHRTIPLVRTPSQLCVRFEPIGASYDNANVDLLTIRLVSIGTGNVSEITPGGSRRVISADADGNGIPELSVCFAGTDIVRLFSSVRGKHTVDAALEGRLNSHRKFRAPLQFTIVGTPAAGPGITASVSPNPLNPRGALRFMTTTPGNVTARLFDISGRLVRTITRSERFEPGEHSLVIDGRDDRGAALATGVYFYRIETPAGTSEGRFVVAK
jgi:hypothetical protein